MRRFLLPLMAVFVLATSVCYGWRAPGYNWHGFSFGYQVGAFDPASLNPFQWLYTATSPTNSIDQSTNLVDAVYLDNNCADFDGTAYVITNEQSPTNNIEIELYFKTTNATAGVLFDSGGFSSSLTGIYVAVNSTKVLCGVTKGTAGVPNYASTWGAKVVNDGEWHHLLFTFNRSTLALEILIDGVSDQSGTAVEDIGTESRIITLGAHDSNTPAGFFTGQYSGFKINDTADIQLAEGASTNVWNRFPSSGTEIEVIILGGQSNQKGANDGEPSAIYDTAMTNNTYYYDLNNSEYYGDDEPLQKAPTNVWSGELALGTLMNSTYGEKERAFIKFAHDGQTMDTFAVGGSMHQILLDRITTATDDLIIQGYSPKVTTFIWMQGESDAGNEALANAYSTNYYSMWNALVDQTYIDDNTKVIICGVGVPLRAYRSTVRAFQSAIGSALGVYIEGEDWDLLVDDVHYSKAGKEAMGVAWFAEVDDFTSSGTTVVPLSPRVMTFANAGWTNGAVPAWNILNGFRVDVQQTAPYIPALTDGANATDGNPISNFSCTNGGYAHNMAESSMVQTNSTLLENPFWSADGISFDTKTVADLNGHYSFSNNVMMKYESVGGVCHIDGLFTFRTNVTWNVADYTNMSNYLGNASCGAGQMNALTDTNGNYVLDVNTNIIFNVP